MAIGPYPIVFGLENQIVEAALHRALARDTATVLRARNGNPYGLRSPLELLSRAAGIRVHHVRPVIANGRVVGAVMLSRTPST